MIRPLPEAPSLDECLRMTKMELKAVLERELEPCRLFLCPDIDIERSRRRFLSYLAGLEPALVGKSPSRADGVPGSFGAEASSRDAARESVRLLRRFLEPENENIAGFSFFQALRAVLNDSIGSLSELSPAFLGELYFLLAGAHSKIDLPLPGIRPEGEEYGTGVSIDGRHGDPRTVFRRRILERKGASEDSWAEPGWQLEHRFNTRQELQGFMCLTPEEDEALRAAESLGIRLALTPHYLSRLNPEGPDDGDRGMRTRAFPSLEYCIRLAELDRAGAGEEPEAGPALSIVARVFSPDRGAIVLPHREKSALGFWRASVLDGLPFDPLMLQSVSETLSVLRHPAEVSIGGADPLCLDRGSLFAILELLASLGSVDRVLIHSSAAALMPMALDGNLAIALAGYRLRGIRELRIIADIANAAEIGEDLVLAVHRFAEAGIPIGNARALSLHNSGRMAAERLRRRLRFAGIDPFHVIADSEKSVSAGLRVPLARLAQELAEEAVRSPVPELSALERPDSEGLIRREVQEAEALMILPDGSRLYRLGWRKPEENGPSLYVDASIFGYLRRMAKSLGTVKEYCSIWYYP